MKKKKSDILNPVWKITETALNRSSITSRQKVCIQLTNLQSLILAEEFTYAVKTIQ